MRRVVLSRTSATFKNLPRGLELTEFSAIQAAAQVCLDTIAVRIHGETDQRPVDLFCSWAIKFGWQNDAAALAWSALVMMPERRSSQPLRPLRDSAAPSDRGDGLRPA
jgi:hypothetical protein